MRRARRKGSVCLLVNALLQAHHEEYGCGECLHQFDFCGTGDILMFEWLPYGEGTMEWPDMPKHEAVQQAEKFVEERLGQTLNKKGSEWMLATEAVRSAAFRMRLMAEINAALVLEHDWIKQIATKDQEAGRDR